MEYPVMLVVNMKAIAETPSGEFPTTQQYRAPPSQPSRDPYRKNSFSEDGKEAKRGGCHALDIYTSGGESCSSQRHLPVRIGVVHCSPKSVDQT